MINIFGYNDATRLLLILKEGEKMEEEEQQLVAYSNAAHLLLIRWQGERG